MIDGFLGAFSAKSWLAQSDQFLLSFFFLSEFPLTENWKFFSFFPPDAGYLADRSIVTVFFVAVFDMSPEETVVALNC